MRRRRAPASRGPQLAAIARDPAAARHRARSALRTHAARSARGRPAAVDAVKQASADADPLVRRAALAALESLPPDLRIALAVPLASDPVRLVRIEAARVLAPVRPECAQPGRRARPTTRGRRRIRGRAAHERRPAGVAHESGHLLRRPAARQRRPRRSCAPALALDPIVRARLREPRRPLSCRAPRARRPPRARGRPAAVPGDASLHYALRARAGARAADGRGVDTPRAGGRPRSRQRALRLHLCGRSPLAGRPREAIALSRRRATPSERSGRALCPGSFNRDQGAVARRYAMPSGWPSDTPTTAEAQRLLAQFRARSSR